MRQTKGAGVVIRPIGMVGKHQKRGKIPPKAGRLAAMYHFNRGKNYKLKLAVLTNR